MAWGEDLQKRIKSLDARGAKDSEYRSLLSTGTKTSLKRGETWRGRCKAWANRNIANRKRLGL